MAYLLIDDISISTPCLLKEEIETQPNSDNLLPSPHMWEIMQLMTLEDDFLIKMVSDWQSEQLRTIMI